MTEDEQDDTRDGENDDHQDDEGELDPADAKRTIEALKAEAGDYRRRLRRTEEERDEAKSAQQSESERALAEAEKRGAESERGKWTRKLVEADLRAAASGVLRDPQDAVRYIDVAELVEVDEGDRDLAKRIKALIDEKPYLASGEQEPSANGRQGARSQGVRTTSKPPPPDGSDWLRSAAKRR